jgi:hypothetical protein
MESAKREYLAKNYKAALAELQAQAIAGDAPAQTMMAKIYLEQFGPKRYQSAQYWLQKATYSGDDEARYYLAIVNSLLANANGGRSADPSTTVDEHGNVTTYRLVRMTLKVPPGFKGPYIAPPYYGRPEGILFSKGSEDDPVSVAIFMSALPFDAQAAHGSVEQRQALAENCLGSTESAYTRRVEHLEPGRRGSLAIAGMPATRLETGGTARHMPIYGAAYCVAADDQLYTFQVMQQGAGDHADAKAALQAVESATFSKD